MKTNLPRKYRPHKKQVEYIRLNKWISNAGICSRREADELIQSGQITVNGEQITILGYQVKTTDTVRYKNKILTANKNVYILLNKCKNCITTNSDPENRKTVLDFVKGACSERIYPIGRLDRNTTGLLVLTNDGELAHKLSHPSYEIKKLYQVRLATAITQQAFMYIYVLIIIYVTCVAVLYPSCRHHHILPCGDQWHEINPTRDIFKIFSLFQTVLRVLR